jgi:hypothetical protein
MHTHTTHTALGWHTGGKYDALVYDAQGNCIANAISNNGRQTIEQDAANAAFIVTACNAHHDLLEACKAMSDWMREHTTVKETLDILTRAHSAMAKATGTTDKDMQRRADAVELDLETDPEFLTERAAIAKAQAGGE